MGNNVPAKPVTVVVADFKKDPAARVSYAQQLAAILPQNPLLQAHTDLLAAATEVVSSGTTLGSSVILADQKTGQAKAAVQVVVVNLGVYDPTFDAFVALAEKYCKTPADVASLFLAARDPGLHYELATPLGLAFKQSAKKQNTWVGHILKAPGMTVGVLETTQTPAILASWVENKQAGLRQYLVDFPPGLWWGRAAHRRGTVTSDFTAPVAFTIK